MSLETIRNLLATTYGDRGREAGAHLAQWLSGSLPFAWPEVLEQMLRPEHLKLLFDSFYRILPVGTGGRRGRVGYGPNRLNPTTVALAVQGHCQYLREKFPDRDTLSVVVANDVRVFNDLAQAYSFLGPGHPLLGVSSRSLSFLACEIYAANGITAYVLDPHDPQGFLATPELAFALPRLGAVGGLNISASHNPPDDNGMKVYDEFGSQPAPPDDQRLVDVLQRAQAVRRLPLAQALDQGLVKPLPKALRSAYVQAYVDLYAGIHRPTTEPIVYTPLCGCGGSTVGTVLKALGFPLLMPPDQGPDGRFAAVPFRSPNPEIPEATQPAQAFADLHGASIVLSSDPDADRVGLEVKLPDGSWQHFTGDQIAAVLCYYLMLDPQGPRRRGLVIETVVTTRLLSKIVQKAGGDTGESWLVDDLLVGFKYVADLLKQLALPRERRNARFADIPLGPERLVLAVEESHGVVMLPSILDKDAVPACMYLAALHQRLHAGGQTLLDYYCGILEELGAADDTSRSITMSGAAGLEKRDAIMAALRAAPPTSLGGSPVRGITDYWDQARFGPFVSDTDTLPRNVIRFETETCIVTVRPSGTEPKLKLYCQLVPVAGASAARGVALLNEVRVKSRATASRVYGELLTRLGVHLSEAALLLPDIVDLERKLDFDDRLAPGLLTLLQRTPQPDLDSALAWLKEHAAAMTPGANPLPALKAPVALLCRGWAAQFGPSPALSALERWSAQP